MNNPVKILLVEDHNDQAETLAKLLNKTGNGHFEIECSDTLKAGLEKKISFAPHATVLDLILPDSNEWRNTIQFLPEGGQPNRFSHPVIVTTGLADPDGMISSECMIAGADNVFFKPFCLNATRNLISAITAGAMRARAAAIREGRSDGR